ncbi:Rieske 2Fe-2S domain-containing protein [Pelagibius sp. Alg239-R121]|uniref:Rieske 2Fe-2S domain-containing protein n=1 Tax=Pelagibius sp. Alg239-R121 TaxID=2993448 RepID=UPI0024A6FFAF|nr:Rieske 2Fe-2S domain-containing protein [Pelagibius sp. Alg239-R121]
METQHRKWHPIAASSDLPLRHTFHGQLLGREFAVWRADDGYVNVWENRCLHRGVRLSIGINDGAELKCQYHGWRYANRTAGCTYIPAHPADAPARTICNRTYPAVERYGLVWSGETPDGELPEISELEAGSPCALRAIPVNAPADLVTKRLAEYRFQPNAKIDGQGAEITVETAQDGHLSLSSVDGEVSTKLLLFVQPVDSNRTVVRGVLSDRPKQEDELRVFLHHSRRLSSLRDLIEAEAAGLPVPEPMQPVIHRVSEELASMPEQTLSGRTAPLRVEVSRKWETAAGIAGLKLVPVGEQLPTFQPGAHIDVHMPNGLVRQYSLTNGPGETRHYTIGVKLEPDSRGGSQCMHREVREGDVLAISEPRNNFPLRRDAVKTLFVAGGIGITPLLSMARALHHSDLPHELHYFSQSEKHMAFPEVLERLGSGVVPHLGLDPAETGKQLKAILSRYQPAMHLYVCGPGPMLEATRKIAADHGWPDNSIHFEYFKNTNEVDDSSSFEIDLARSVMTLQVPAGKTILAVLRENGVDVPSSCEQGACGTCLTTLLEGEPDHQDVYLNESEKSSGNCIMTCVSRAKSGRLVLDI